MANEPVTLSYVHVGKTVARFVEGVAATGDEKKDRRRIQLWCNRLEEAALRLLDDHEYEPIDMVVCTREYFDELRDTPDINMGVVHAAIAWRDLATHLEHCVTCGQTSTDDCFDGKTLKDEAEGIDKRLGELGVDALNADKGPELSDLHNNSPERASPSEGPP